MNGAKILLICDIVMIALGVYFVGKRQGRREAITTFWLVLTKALSSEELGHILDKMKEYSLKIGNGGESK